MVIKFTNIFHSKAIQNLPKLGFLFENNPSGNPGWGWGGGGTWMGGAGKNALPIKVAADPARQSFVFRLGLSHEGLHLRPRSGRPRGIGCSHHQPQHWPGRIAVIVPLWTMYIEIARYIFQISLGLQTYYLAARIQMEFKKWNCFC
jgi:hypothetical protein